MDPPNPKELTPARRGCAAPRIQGRASVLMKKGESSRSSFELGRATLMVGGSTLWCRAMTALNSPAAPAAAFVWPIWDFTLPSATWGPSGPAASPYTSERPPNSAASPAIVPVPWASTSSMVDGSNPACS